MAFTLLLAALAASPPTYRCLDGTMFTLSASPSVAIVRFKDQEYRMQRRPSGIAIKYQSKMATLYLDGDFAAFVAEDRPLPGCTKVAKARQR